MLRLIYFCKSKYIWSFGYGSMGCDDINGWYFGGPDDEWYAWVPDDELSVWVPGIYWRSLGSTMDSP